MDAPVRRFPTQHPFRDCRPPSNPSSAAACVPCSTRRSVYGNRNQIKTKSRASIDQTKQQTRPDTTVSADGGVTHATRTRLGAAIVSQLASASQTPSDRRHTSGSSPNSTKLEAIHRKTKQTRPDPSHDAWRTTQILSAHVKTIKVFLANRLSKNDLQDQTER